MDLSRKSLSRLALELSVASFVVLFQELTIIRWLPAQVRVIAYFPNLILISAFLGLGVGCLRAGRASLLWSWPLSLAALVAGAWGMSRVVFTQNSASEHLWLLYYDLKAGAPVVPDVRLPIVLCFLLGTATFVPLGQVVAERLSAFRERSSPLWGYCWDIAGSIAGVVAFTAVSWAGAFPVVWFAVFLGAGVVLALDERRHLFTLGAAAAVILGLVAATEKADLYSPYYAIRVDGPPGRTGFAVLANGSLHQFALPVRHDDGLATDAQRSTREGYHLPYRILGRPPRRALVLGAGTGNDVAVLLDEGAEHVDAVEIDPGILAIGRQRHPDDPYASPRVTAFNMDARSFLNGQAGQYDVVVFGTLDSMTRLSALSNVRLDNFVYTAECLRAARAHLSPDGGVVMYFMVAADYIDLRLASLIAGAFGETPLVAQQNYGLFNRIYMAGPAFAREKGEARRGEAADFLGRAGPRTEVPTDDWPYLYVSRRGVSVFYLSLMAILGLLSLLAVLLASREIRASLRGGGGMDVEMFLFGLAFLLLETRAVTEMSLVWGATWMTNAIVFGAILLMILLATAATELRPLPWGFNAAALGVSLIASYAIPAKELLGVPPAPKLFLSILYVGLPIFFAASTFAILFKDRADSARAFGWNVLGAVAGGLLEILSMAVGLRALLLVALAAYLCAFLVRMRAAPVAALP